jgi:hypothetical protein
MRTICTRSSLCLPTCRPPPPSTPSLAARVAPWRARTLHASQEASFFTHTATFLHFRCVTQLASAPRSRAQFSAYWDINGVRGRAGAYMDLDEVSVLGHLFAFFSIVAGLDLLPSYIYTLSHRPLFFASFPHARPPHFSLDHETPLLWSSIASIARATSLLFLIHRRSCLFVHASTVLPPPPPASCFPS